MNALAVAGSVASIIGLLLSVILICRTGKIQNNVRNAMNQNAKIREYNKNKQDILQELNECVKFFLDEHALEEQKPYIQRMDVALSELRTYHPHLTKEINQDIETIRASFVGSEAKPIGYLTIMKQMNNIIAVLKQEDIIT